MNLKEIKELIDLIQKSGIEELDLEKAGVRIRIKKPHVHPVRESLPLQTPPTPSVPKTPQTVPSSEGEQVDQTGLVTLTSPVVGTFYLAPAPDADPYSELGSFVKKGQILCVIEAMKLMNEIESEADGQIMEILIENGQAVEYGQPLFRIDPLKRS